MRDVTANPTKRARKVRGSCELAAGDRRGRLRAPALSDRPCGADQARHRLPLGTFAVNVVGCLVLGLLTGAVAAGLRFYLQLFLGTGLCGALTTYSTFSYETLRLTETGAGFYAAANVLVSVTAGLGAAFAGVSFAQALWA